MVQSWNDIPRLETYLGWDCHHDHHAGMPTNTSQEPKHIPRDLRRIFTSPWREEQVQLLLTSHQEETSPAIRGADTPSHSHCFFEDN